MRNTLVFAVIALIVISILVSAQPTGPVITIVNSSRAPIRESASLVAWAGNITQLNIQASSTTRTWAGFFGNISGHLTLDDSINRTLFNWSNANPTGEIFATTSTIINWSDQNIRCWNFTQSLDEEDINISEIENTFNISTTDTDGIDETFTFTGQHKEFFVGTAAINANTCPRVSLFNATAVSSVTNFQEVILYDDTNNQLIFTAMLENDKLGFTNESTDFEMIVPEDGHLNSNPTTYYFYVELS